MRKHSRWLVLALGTWLLMGGRQAHADLIEIQSVTGHQGSYTGSLDYQANSNGTSATLTISLTNTSSASGPNLTAFVFNNPNPSVITSVNLTSAPPGFSLLSGTHASAGPYGQFAFGAGTGPNFESAANASSGLAPSSSQAIFTFTLSNPGGGLQNITAASFFSTLSTGASPKFGDQAFVARFIGSSSDHNDRVPGVDPPIPHKTPEPGSLTLAALGALGLLGMARARRKRGSSQAG